MPEQQPQIPIQPVDRPIICSPYEEPREHWQYDPITGVPHRTAGRRPAGYWFKEVRTGTAQGELFAEEHRADLPLVNALREDVARWRDAAYRGASQVTRDLLNYWADPGRARRIFFCQREAVETIVYLLEMRLTGRTSRTGFHKFQVSDDDFRRLLLGQTPTGFQLVDGGFHPTLIDRPADANLLPLRRLGCKMATGAGKTVVMAMLVSWAFCNRGTNRESIEYPAAVFVCCPNLTVKERLQVLRPEHPDNYYAAFDLVPVKYRHLLGTGRVSVENWHRLGPESEHREGDRSYAVVNKGPETPETLARRALGDDIYERMPIMVLNDEGHHCWRPAPVEDHLSGEEKKDLEEEQEEARVWLEGLDQINNAWTNGQSGVAFCIDMSATPFYIRGSGHPEGLPFPWIVTDFGLVDAIESGIVKIPRLPVRDLAGGKDDAGRPDPKYFRLWLNITANLRPNQKHASGKPKAEVVYERTHGALVQIAGQWVERFRQIQEAGPNHEHIPPVLIIVCDNTEIADVFFRKISGEREEDVPTAADVEELEEEDTGEGEDGRPVKGRNKKPKTLTVYGAGEVFPGYLGNTRERKYTIRIDSKLLAEAESEDPNKTRQKLAEELRKVVATVGKPGQPGEHVRCVVSVAMLTEGWDASNVTHILGVRAFGSQLLCEQVVGRGLRRISYDPDPRTGLLSEEYVDVYGIPFSVIPFKGRPAGALAPEDRPRHHVSALPDRASMEIRFPVVEKYVFALVKNLIHCDVDRVEPIDVDSRLEPIATFLQPAAGYHDQPRSTAAGFQFVRQDRQEYYEQTHLQTIQFQLAQRIIDELLAPSAGSSDAKSRVFRLQSRHQLFPQVFRVVKAYTERRVNYNGVDRRELGVEKYARLVVERLRPRIEPDSSQGESPLLPVLNRYRPVSGTAGVDFVTVRPVFQTTKSHVNLVVQDSDWEGAAAQALEMCTAVEAYARNDHVGLTIAYEYLGGEHSYEPDFIVRLTNGLMVLLEVKGYEVHDPERNNSKHTAAQKWISAVNNLGEFGTWEFTVCRNTSQLRSVLEAMAARPLRAAVAV
jgi:type III restriction enzyme